MIIWGSSVLCSVLILIFVRDYQLHVYQGNMQYLEIRKVICVIIVLGHMHMLNGVDRVQEAHIKAALPIRCSYFTLLYRGHMENFICSFSIRRQYSTMYFGKGAIKCYVPNIINWSVH